MTRSPTTTGIVRLEAAFALARKASRGAVIPYVCAGDPNLATTATVLKALATIGADVIEIGFPYGDPLADGPTIASAAQRALDAGATIDSVLAVARDAHAAGGPPLLAFTYINPIMQYGFERFADGLLSAGMCGAIVPDLPLEETPVVRGAFGPRGLALPLLVAPTTPAVRAIEIARVSDGFIYIVSRLGVTSAAREPDLQWIADRVGDLRRAVTRPIAVGFGISRPAQVEAICRYADGVIVGSALLDAMAGLEGNRAAAAASGYLKTLVVAAAHRRLEGTAPDPP